MPTRALDLAARAGRKALALALALALVVLTYTVHSTANAIRGGGWPSRTHALELAHPYRFPARFIQLASCFPLFYTYSQPTLLIGIEKFPRPILMEALPLLRL